MKNEIKRRKYETFCIAVGEGQVAYYRHEHDAPATAVPIKCLFGAAEIEAYKAREGYDYAHFFTDAGGARYVRLEANKQIALF